MKAKELIAILAECDPDAIVEVHLNAAMVDREPKSENECFEYAFEPVVTPTWPSYDCEGLATRVGIEINMGVQQ